MKGFKSLNEMYDTLSNIQDELVSLYMKNNIEVDEAENLCVCEAHIRSAMVNLDSVIQKRKRL